MSAKLKRDRVKPLSLAQYEGLITRVCGAFGVMPAADTPFANMERARFDAVVRLCDDEAKGKRDQPVADNQRALEY